MRLKKPYKHEYGRKYWHYFLRMDNHPPGWPLLYETPLGMIFLYGKVLRQSCLLKVRLYPARRRL